MEFVTQEQLLPLATACGLDLFGCLKAEELKEDRQHLASWQSEGKAGAMHYMNRPPALFTSPEKLLPGVRSILLATIRYSSERHPDRPEGFGRVARYAWGKDYHLVLRDRLEKFVGLVEETIGRKITARVFSDSVPLLERAYARKAGLGFVGKNTLLIQKGIGSFSFIAEILWDIEVEQSEVRNDLVSSCGSCSRCSIACPTDALVEPYSLDARKCISYLSIEKRGALELWEKKALGEWIFGCDLCQECCPFNHTVIKIGQHAALSEFMKSEGVGPLLDLSQLLKIREGRDFNKRFAETPLLRTRREGLLRNAAVVAANTHSFNCADALIDCAEHDSSAIIRSHALWAITELNQIERICSDATLSRLCSMSFLSA